MGVGGCRGPSHLTNISHNPFITSPPSTHGAKAFFDEQMRVWVFADGKEGRRGRRGVERRGPIHTFILSNHRAHGREEWREHRIEGAQVQRDATSLQ